MQPTITILFSRRKLKALLIVDNIFRILSPVDNEVETNFKTQRIIPAQSE